MRYHGYSNCDLANGPGARVSLWCQGCSMQCSGCFSPDTWDRFGGAEFDETVKAQLLKDLGNSYIQGLSILGGDPLEPYNVDEVTALCKEIKEKYPTKTIWLWTGRKKEKVENLPIMQYLDVVVSDPYIAKFNNGRCKYRGSSNQRVWWAKTGKPYDAEPLEDEHHMNEQLTENGGEIKGEASGSASGSCSLTCGG